MFVKRPTPLSVLAGAKLRRPFCVLMILVAFSAQATAQFDPTSIVLGVIQQFQTGTVNPTWYSTNLWQTIAVQTDNSGKYPALNAIGPPLQVDKLEEQPFPNGVIYALKVLHLSGISLWNVGVSFRTQRIELLVFNISSPPASSPTPPPTPSWPSPGGNSFTDAFIGGSSPFGNSFAGREGLPEAASPDRNAPSPLGALPRPDSDTCSRYPALC
jgi:hypothetical protein